MSWKHNPRSYEYRWETRGSESPYGQSYQASDPNTVYVKGACKNNGREGAQGGIGVFWDPNNARNISSTHSGRQTNQRASLEAATKAIEQAKAQNKDRLTVYTDNHLVIKGMNEWIHNWKENDWKTSKNKEVVHKDQFSKLDTMTQDMKVEWKYVPASSKVEGNTEAKRLAREATRKK
ncbi:ribonuclease H1-like [Trichosurus vulpecula]|uniref:ribonuclease H1-like n=1 Tax=Trichosurus vulpecula TaxID=9337 RepID=UPI00186AFA48|nr:ribonuclease H1-like [Trichosurus vulpecula]XP_036606695.1 ribonuclease H1-like [Trichosurus vulpecula]